MTKYQNVFTKKQKFMLKNYLIKPGLTVLVQIMLHPYLLWGKHMVHLVFAMTMHILVKRQDQIDTPYKLTKIPSIVYEVRVNSVHWVKEGLIISCICQSNNT